MLGWGIATVVKAERVQKQTDRGRPHLLFVVNVDWFFLSHRLPLALAARDAGFTVTVAAADTGQSKRIQAEGLGFVPLPFTRSGTGLFHELGSLMALWRLYRKLRPDLIHHVTIKPVLYGSIAARLRGAIPCVNAVSGLGYTFTDADRSRGLRSLATTLYRFAFKHPRSKVIFQNPDDIETFLTLKLIQQEQVVLIRGSGVDCKVFRPTPEPEGPPVVVLPSRMLWDKGVREYVEAARILRDQSIEARFALVGGSDEGNPTAVPTEQLRSWNDDGTIEWWGHSDKMQEVFAQSSIVVLPSYREGLPKVLLEAAACGLPIVTTDVPGCREVVQHDVNGLLVPARRAKELAEAMKRLIQHPGLRREFGERGRERAVAEFSLDIVVRQTMDVYANLIGVN